MKDLITQQLKEVGLGVGAFMLMSWMVVTLTTGMVKSIDSINEKITDFTVKVGYEHQDQMQAQEELMVQHKEITAALGRINGYKD